MSLKVLSYCLLLAKAKVRVEVAGKLGEGLPVPDDVEPVQLRNVVAGPSPPFTPLFVAVDYVWFSSVAATHNGTPRNVEAWEFTGVGYRGRSLLCRILNVLIRSSNSVLASKLEQIRPFNVFFFLEGKNSEKFKLQ